MLQIRRMQGRDIPFAIRLSDQEKWGVARRDLARILRLDPRGSFVATVGGRRIGLATTTSYGGKLAWIGNVIVQRNFRGKHVGVALVNTAVKYLQQRRVRHIALYCFDDNVIFYRRLGFVRDAPLLRLRRKPAQASSVPSAHKIQRSFTLSQILSLDKIAFGADRSRLIRRILRENAGWYVSLPDSYLLVKQYGDMFEFGPWICRRGPGDEPRQMLEVALSKTSDKPIELSCLQNHREARTLLLKHGFRVVNHGYRMYFQGAYGMGDDRMNYALGFLDKG